MEIRHLRTFVMLAQELHFGQAAKRLNTSQPVVSRTLKELETEIGTALMRRSARKVELTRAGRLFLVRACDALENIAAGTRAARAGDDDGLGHVRLGLTIGAAQPFTAQIVARLRLAYPGASVQLRTLNERTLVSALTEREVDAAIVSADCQPGRIARQEVGRVPLTVVCAEDHPIAAGDIVKMEDLVDVPLVLPNPHAHPMMHDLIRTVLRRHGVEPYIAAAADEGLQMLSIAATRTAVAIAPVFPGLYLPGVVRRPIHPAMEIPFNLTWTQQSRVTDALVAAAEA